MIKIVILLFVSLCFTLASAVCAITGSEHSNQQEVWVKVEKKFWLGADYKSYRLDSNHDLLISDDFINWRPSADSVWKDRFGSPLCFYDHKLLGSYDGTSWDELAGHAWQSIDGNWYRLDQDGTLWISTNAEQVAGN